MPYENLLRCSFQHLPGISALKEERLWAKGILDWTDLNQNIPVQMDMYAEGGNPLQLALEASEKAFANRDIAFFANRLPKREYYRIASSFPKQCVFLDIETTGLSTYYDDVTVVGWSIGDTYTALIEPKKIEKLESVVRENQLVVTFNGSLFDLPFLSKAYQVDWSSIFHIDLRYLARRVGLTGGQKRIEVEIGLIRKAEIEGLTGAEAVVLWFDYKEGDLNALRDLVRYNHADIEGMKSLLEEAIRRIAPQPIDRALKMNLFDRSSIQFAEMQSVESERAINIRPYRGKIGPRLTLARLCGEVKPLHGTTIVGIDLTGSERRKSGWATVTGSNLTMELLTSDAELIDHTLAVEPFLVSIDSPLSLPAGRESEFDNDPGRNEYGIVREAERQLRKRGVHVYPALLPSMQRLTQRGVGLATLLRKRGIPVIESYPGAAQDILGIPRKKTSLKHLVEGLRRFGYTNLPNSGIISHDELDAATSALVGQFMLAGYWEALGSTDEDYLIVPTVDRRPLEIRPSIVVGLSGSIAAGKTTAAKILQRLGFHYCRFSEIIEQQVRRQGVLVTRASLQAFGHQAYNSRFGQRQLQNRLAEFVEPAQKIVVDGLRHPEDHAYLRERWGMAATHVHLDAPDYLRVQRYVATPNGSAEAFNSAQRHAVEQNVHKMKGLADVTVLNCATVDDLEARVKLLASGK